MKKVVVSLLVLAFVALAATGTVSAQCAAKTTTSTCAATTCAQATSCTTSTCCCCPCPVTCCCPAVTCCVVTQCCEVKEVKGVKEVKEAKEAKEKMAPVVAKGEAAAAASNVGSGQAAATTQTIKQSNTQTIKTGAVTDSVPDSTFIGGDQTNIALNTNVPINLQVKDIQVAWNGGQAGTDIVRTG